MIVGEPRPSARQNPRPGSPTFANFNARRHLATHSRPKKETVSQDTTGERAFRQFDADAVDQRQALGHSTEGQELPVGGIFRGGLVSE